MRQKTRNWALWAVSLTRDSLSTLHRLNHRRNAILYLQQQIFGDGIFYNIFDYDVFYLGQTSIMTLRARLEIHHLTLNWPLTEHIYTPDAISIINLPCNNYSTVV
ncbi:hypothetical protein AOR01nite_11250 [Acetobacter orleanensis]|uniref:Uncharacterized protein n=1 Tax=Acetobacter orleanensis TaxID=104099 RepID=A0A4Y3TLH5_9PROT|nr:hypothetical protein Abol_019_024 [Acetobacter orleanensis JCM 7639]GEB82648.1 hypothetical protein AOR01nite_11250 [Acetobacter orleanensis]